MASEAGKGDKPRKVDPKKWDDGWDRIFGGKRRDEAEKNAKVRAQLDAMPVAERVARDIGLWAEPFTRAGSSKKHNELLLEYAEAIEKRKTYTMIRPVIGGTCGECKHYTQRLPRFPTMQCSNQDVVIAMAEGPADGAWLEPSPDFGCNRWECK